MKVRDFGQRVVCHYSHGDCSAVAAKLALAKYGPDRVVVMCCDTGAEHPDNARFRADCERWFGVPIQMLKSDKYRDVDDVIERERFFRRFPYGGSKCRMYLKVAVGQRFEQPDDIHIYGYAADNGDMRRWERFVENYPEMMLSAPLIEQGLTKDDCHAIVQRAGIEIPMMYRLGFSNNNCIGCVNAETATYWNRVRRHFPEVFERRAKQERELNFPLVRVNKEPVFLDELPPDEGGDEVEPHFDCSLFCLMATSTIGDAA